jgi:hypothetical protein
MTTTKMKSGRDVLETYRNWNISPGRLGYVAEHLVSGASFSTALISTTKIMIRRCEVGTVRLQKGTPTKDGAVFHYTTYSDECFTIRRNRYWVEGRSGNWNVRRTCWNIYQGDEAGPKVDFSKFCSTHRTLHDARSWLKEYQTTQMCEEENPSTLVDEIKHDVMEMLEAKIHKLVEKAVETLVYKPGEEN